jgi:hypothetical protein
MFKGALQALLMKWWEITVDIGPALEVINQVDILRINHDAEYEKYNIILNFYPQRLHMQGLDVCINYISAANLESV